MIEQQRARLKGKAVNQASVTETTSARSRRDKACVDNGNGEARTDTKQHKKRDYTYTRTWPEQRSMCQ
jgi:hypothetical protein